jgi:hypothetical protein
MLILQHGLPKFYIKMLAGIEDLVKEVLKDSDAKKKMKPAVVRALQQMKLKVKKHNEKFKTAIEDFRSNPEKYEEIDDDEEEEDDDDEIDDEDEEDDEDELLSNKKPDIIKVSLAKKEQSKNKV